MTRAGYTRGLPALFATLVLSTLALFSCGGREPAGGVAAQSSRSRSTVQDTGSDTLVNLALAWAEAFMTANPEVRIAVTGGGSGTGIAALINGTVQIANASREMSAEEIAAARANGIEPVRHVVARDAIAVVVHLSNPVERLTLSQVSALYTGRIRNWREVGGEARPVVLLSRESNSGTYQYFLEQVIRLGRKDSTELFSAEALLMPASEGIIAEVRQNPNAIGYDGLGYVTSDEKTLRLAREAAGPFVLPSARSVNDGTYPISRPLFMYTAGEPQGSAKRFLDYVTTEGQSLVSGLGFVPLR